MDKVNGLIILSIINCCFIMTKAQIGSCQMPNYYCMKYSSQCTNGIDPNVIYNTQVLSCGDLVVTGTACEIANGPHCQASRGFQQPGSWTGRFVQSSQPPGSWNTRFIPGYQTTLGAGSRPLSCNIQDWRQRALKQTNYLRSLHGVQPLQEDPEIQRYAQNYAESQIYAAKLKHSNYHLYGYGENVKSAWASRTSDFLKSYSPEYLVQSWYNEIANWNFATSSAYGTGATGHFTQLVWKESKKVGHGIAFDQSCTKVVMIANYSPAGNYMSRARENVLPPNSNPVGPQQPGSPMSFGRQIGGSVKKGASIQLGKMCSGSSLLLFWLRAMGYIDSPH